MIVDLQRSVRTVGRIRIGQQVATRNGRTAPAKLTTFRLSSPQRAPIDRAARLYGGKVAPMTSDRSDDQWEVVTEVASLPVVIPPVNHLSQHYELWDAAGCQRRCDGREATVIDGRPVRGVLCECDPDRRDCTITTRLSVVLPDLEALGVWRLDTKGWYAATELAGAADLCAAATSRGLAIPARLDLEQRSRRSRGPDGKPQVFKFAVPVLSVDVSIPQAQAILGRVNVDTGEIAGETRVELEPPAPRQLEQTAPAELPPPPPADIPKPRTHDQYLAAGDEKPPETSLAGDPPTLKETAETLQDTLPLAGRKPLREDQKFAMDLGIGDADRHSLYAIATGKPEARYADLSTQQRNKVQRWAHQLKNGIATLEQIGTES